MSADSGARPVAIVTGASAGIGAELARVFARHGHELLLVARREPQLQALADEIAASGRPRPHVLALDIGHPDAVARIDGALAAHGLAPQYVVNNAGFGLIGQASGLPRGEQLEMIDVNVRALTELSLAWIDALLQQRGGILNVASVAGFLPGPGMAVYYASKAYVLSFSEALHHELRPRGVRVTALCPGPVATEFQARAGIDSERESSPAALPARQLAEEGFRALMQGRRLVVPGAINKAVTGLVRFVPRAVLLALIDRRQRRRSTRYGGAD